VVGDFGVLKVDVVPGLLGQCATWWQAVGWLLVAESEEDWWLWSLMKVLLGGWLIAESEDDW
jgi:hypothetical protein